MPDFELVSLEEARFRTMPGRQGTVRNDYAGYIQLLTAGQAGKLHPVGNEKPATIRRWLAGTAQALGTSLTIKRAGQDIYFWREEGRDMESRPRQGRRPRLGSPGGPLPFPDQPFRVPQEGERRAPAEESPELGQMEEAEG